MPCCPYSVLLLCAPPAPPENVKIAIFPSWGLAFCVDATVKGLYFFVFHADVEKLDIGGKVW